MKKRILALLLAGLMTASLAACVQTQERPDNPNGGTEVYGTQGNNNTNTPPTPVTWTDANEQVYVTAAMTLTAVDNTGTTTVRAMDTLQRLKIGSNNQSIVEKDGKQYYAASKNLTSDDLLGLTFTSVSDKKMYVATDVLNIRQYASSDNSYSPTKASLTMNETVTVIAMGEKWNMIKYEENGTTKNYFVFAEYLSETEVINPNDINNYPAYSNFTTYTEFKTMYVIVHKEGGSLAVRTCPSADSTAKIYLKREDMVTVVKTGTIDGTQWSEIAYKYTDSKTGEEISVSGFVNSKYISETKTGTALVSLDELLRQYSFTALDPAQTLYATGGLKVRSTPEFLEDDSNLVTSLEKADSVKVVALGEHDGIVWAIIEGETGEYCFTSRKYLTTDSTGEEAPMTLDQLITAYPNFKACAERTEYVAIEQQNCYTIPEKQPAEDVKKTLKKGDTVTVVAEGTINYIHKWYIFRVEGDNTLYFASASSFSAQQPTA